MSDATEPLAPARSGSANAPAAEAPPAPCANCGHPRNDRFCPKCGQNDRDYIRSLPPLIGDILKETFELDSRIRRTIGPLFLRPGELASEFSRNRRARYISVIRLYLVASIGFFFLMSLGELRQPPSDARYVRSEPPRLAEARENADIDALKAVLPPAQRRKVDEILARPGRFGAKSFLYELSKLAASLDASGRWRGGQLELGFDYGACTDCWFDGLTPYLIARTVDVLEDPAEALSLLIDSLPFAMFVTLPAYALLLMLFFLGSRRFYTEHLVFAVQLHTFAFIVFAASLIIPDDEQQGQQGERGERGERAAAVAERGFRAELAGPDADQSGIEITLAADAPETQDASAAPAAAPVRSGDADDGRDIRIEAGGSFADWVELALFLWVLAYHYLALRRYYGNGRFRTTVKWMALTVSYGILLIPGMLLSLAIAMVQLG